MQIDSDDDGKKSDKDSKKSDDASDKSDDAFHPDIEAQKDTVAACLDDGITKEGLIDYFKKNEKVTEVDNWEEQIMALAERHQGNDQPAANEDGSADGDKKSNDSKGPVDDSDQEESKDAKEEEVSADALKVPVDRKSVV